MKSLGLLLYKQSVKPWVRPKKLESQTTPSSFPQHSYIPVCSDLSLCAALKLPGLLSSQQSFRACLAQRFCSALKIAGRLCIDSETEDIPAQNELTKQALCMDPAHSLTVIVFICQQLLLAMTLPPYSACAGWVLEGMAWEGTILGLLSPNFSTGGNVGWDLG